MTDEEKKLVVGGAFMQSMRTRAHFTGQASLWTEQTDSMNMETVMWPRAAALAELFWTGSAHGSFPLSTFPQVSNR
jgi:N-acetyl-beta-hexosaminidase